MSVRAMAAARIDAIECALRDIGPMTRAQITARLGMSKSVVKRAVQALVASGRAHIGSWAPVTGRRAPPAEILHAGPGQQAVRQRVSQRDLERQRAAAAVVCVDLETGARAMAWTLYQALWGAA